MTITFCLEGIFFPLFVTLGLDGVARWTILKVWCHLPNLYPLRPPRNTRRTRLFNLDPLEPQVPPTSSVLSYRFSSWRLYVSRPLGFSPGELRLICERLLIILFCYTPTPPIVVLSFTPLNDLECLSILNRHGVSGIIFLD